jgi:hypothetical protein
MRRRECLIGALRSDLDANRPCRSISNAINNTAPIKRATEGRMANALYYGDNLAVLRESIASESVDLIYLDPPFNSSANYNVLFSRRLAADRKRKSKPSRILGIGGRKPKTPFIK